jgi:transcriptional regulator with XRE-family HTH domain
MILLRQVIGEELRRSRIENRKTLRDISAQASVSLAYLSEVERGLKEPSSEILNAICGSLTISVSDLLTASAFELARHEEKSFASELTSMMN